MNVKKEIETISKAMQDDSDYAWSWHCNIAMCFIDEGGDPLKANKAAARFMKLAFDVDTSKNKHYDNL